MQEHLRRRPGCAEPVIKETILSRGARHPMVAPSLRPPLECIPEEPTRLTPVLGCSVRGSGCNPVAILSVALHRDWSAGCDSRGAAILGLRTDGSLPQPFCSRRPAGVWAGYRDYGWKELSARRRVTLAQRYGRRGDIEDRRVGYRSCVTAAGALSGLVELLFRTLRWARGW